MRKILPILTLAFASFFIYSCDNNDDEVVAVDNSVYAQVRDVTGTFTSANNFKISQGLNIPSTDVVLVYRNVGTGSGANAVWQIIPKTYFLNDNVAYPANRELDYNFDFTTQDVEIRTEANFNQATQMTASEATQYLTNQTFRIVLIPGVSGKNINAVNTSDYNAVIKYYNLNDSNVVSAKVN